MARHIVAAMNKPCLRSSNLLGEANGLVECLMRVMWQRAQGIDYQNVTMFSIGNFIFCNGLHVSDVD